MAKKNDRVVFKNEDGKWANKKVKSVKASSLHDTQQQAEKQQERCC